MLNRGDPATDPTPLHPHSEPLADPRRERLEALRVALGAMTELRTRLVPASRSGTTILRVVNPPASHLAEEIGCDLSKGTWRFTWPLTDSGTLGPADDIDNAVNAVEHVLSARM
jgi:hypothetical protein